jgi:ankyrin repeat protein
MGSLSLSAVSKLKRSVSHKRKLSKKMLPLIKRELEIEENLHRSTEKLIQSIIDCNIDNLKASLDSGANVNAKYNNWSLLHYACSMIDDTSNLGTEQHLEMIRVLLENGAEINTEDEDKWTPLHLACQQGMTSVISYLIKKGADEEASTIENLRPIDLVEPDNYIAISFLISSSVKVNERHL